MEVNESKHHNQHNCRNTRKKSDCRGRSYHRENGSHEKQAKHEASRKDVQGSNRASFTHADTASVNEFNSC